MKLIVKSAKPRNPMVAPSLRRKAGKHRLSDGSRRRLADAGLRRELDWLIRAGP